MELARTKTGFLACPCSVVGATGKALPSIYSSPTVADLEYLGKSTNSASMKDDLSHRSRVSNTTQRRLAPPMNGAMTGSIARECM
jgi:hypothetical protein